MNCPNCGQQVNPGEKFCINCGAALTQTDQTSSAAGEQDHSVQTAQVAAKGKALAKSYWGFLVRTLKRPVEASLKETSHYYGYISIGLSALFLALSSALMIRNAMSGFSGYIDTPDFFSMFIGPCIGLFISFFLNAAVTFTIIHVVHKTHIGFNVFVTQYAGQATPAVFAAAAVFLLELLTVNNFLTGLIFILAIALLYFPAVSSVFVYKNNGSFDRLYAYLISAAAIAIVQSIYFMLMAVSLLSQVMNSIHSNLPFSF